MPNNKIDALYREIKDQQSVSESYAPFLAAMDALNEEMTELMKPDKDGWKMLDNERFQSLTDKYRASGLALEAYLTQTEQSTDPNETELREKVKKLGELIAADMAVMQQYRPKNEKEQKSLPTLLEEARIPILDQGSQLIKSVSGSQSDRLPMTIVGPNGEALDGMFTKAKIYDPLGDITGAAASAAGKAATEQGRELFRNLMTAYKNYYTQNPDPNKPVSDDPNMVLRFLVGIAKDTGILSYAADTNKLVAELAKINDMTPQAVKTACGKNALKEFASKVKAPYADIYCKTFEAKMENKTRLDRKNTGMSIVAGLLNLQRVVCHSQPMKLKGPDGKIVDGTFMAFAKGVDPMKPGSRGYFLNRDSMSQADARALEDISDLQVLDYLCGNTDRHGYNVFYVVDDNGKLIGVQGIDNDSSFGGIEMQKQRTRRMPMPSIMGVISKKTAERIMNLSPSELAFSLRGIVDEPSIKAACERLKLLKTAIEVSRGHLDPNKKDIKYPYIRELDSKDFRKADLQKLTDPRIHNHFSEFKKVIGGISGRASASNNDPDTELVGSVNRATEGGVIGQILKMKAFTKKLSDCTSYWRGSSSQNYLDLEKAVKDYQTLQEKINDRMKKMREKAAEGDISPETLYGRYVTRFDMIEMKKSLEKLKTAADTYANGKLAYMEAKGKALDDDKYIKHRIEAAQEISRFAEEGLTISAEEQEALGSNSRRATEQYVHQTNAKEKKEAENGDLIIRKDSEPENNLIRT